jgi:hypothetical protein
MGEQLNTRSLTVLAQDPAVRINGKLLLTTVSIPYEELADGPVGYRVKVIDYDASADVLYQPLQVRDAQGELADPYARPEGKLSAADIRAWENRLLADPAFHAQNAYAIVMRTLARFEFALGRRVEWGFVGHQLHIAPHAFAEANAYYSEQDKALMFGYFPSARLKKTVFTCLSHDIVAHETTHALLDGIRDGFTAPSTPDQAAFHEGFADVIALLSVFSLPQTVEAALLGRQAPARRGRAIRKIAVADVTPQKITESFLMGLGKEFGQGLDSDGVRADCLRRSAELLPNRHLLEQPAYQEAHARGEVFAAAFLRAFIAIWSARIATLGTFDGIYYNLDTVVDEGARAATHLLNIAIRALDYCPPVDLTFGAYLSALLTSDAEVAPDDSAFGYRAILTRTFATYGIVPSALRTDPATGRWREFEGHDDIVYYRSNFNLMLHQGEEVFRFLWENRKALNIDDRGYMRVCSVRASIRQGPDGFFLRETICEYTQIARMFAAEARSQMGIERPEGMPTTQRITAYGGGTLVFDQYGRIKYHIEHRLDDAARQSQRLAYLWQNNLLDQVSDTRNHFSMMHRRRVEP